MREPSECAASTADLLRATGVRFALIGALAALRYRREPRLTTDVDFLVDYDTTLFAVFEAAGYDVTVHADEGDPPHAAFVRGRGDRIDLLFPVVEYQQVALDRAVANDNVLTVEDVLVHKLIAWRPRDRDDIASILGTGLEFDEVYVEHWAREWAVLDRWVESRPLRDS